MALDHPSSKGKYYRWLLIWRYEHTCELKGYGYPWPWLGIVGIYINWSKN